MYNKVPHINQEKGLFLRGGPHYLCGKTEEDSVKSHQHLVIKCFVFYTILTTSYLRKLYLSYELYRLSVVACIPPG